MQIFLHLHALPVLHLNIRPAAAIYQAFIPVYTSSPFPALLHNRAILRVSHIRPNLSHNINMQQASPHPVLMLHGLQILPKHWKKSNLCQTVLYVLQISSRSPLN